MQFIVVPQQRVVQLSTAILGVVGWVWGCAMGVPIGVCFWLSGGRGGTYMC